VVRIENARKVATVQPIVGPPVEVQYDIIVVAPGSVSRTLPIPGLRENAVGFKTIGEAIWLRNHVLEQLDVAATTVDAATRKRALTFVFVGGGYAGIEALAEMEDMTRDALRYYDELDPSMMRWILVEATKRCYPRSTATWAPTRSSSYAAGDGRPAETRLESCVDGLVTLSDGDSFEADTIV
jgi:NADH dehydrogenase